MSIFQSETLKCPACGQDNRFDAIYSISADRRQDVRDAILDDSLQRGGCEACGEVFRLDPELTYLSIEDGQWILAGPLSRLSDWADFERQAQSAFDTAYGSAAPAAAQAIGKALQPRVALGWAALREKLIVARQGLDDTTLELLKLVLMRGPLGEHLADDTELRLVFASADVLGLAWLRGATGEVLDAIELPRSVYDEVVADEADFSALRSELNTGPYVDVNRLLVEATQSA